MNWRRLSSFLSSRTLLMLIGALIVGLMIFQLGVLVGFRKARFSYQWSERSTRMFEGNRRGSLGGLRHEKFLAGHGALGSIMSINESSLIIDTGNGVEKTVVITGETIVRRDRLTLTLNDLQIGDTVIVIGSPREDGAIQARMIRADDENKAPRRPPRQRRWIP